MIKLFKIRLIVTVLIIAILASVISVAIVIENKSSVIVIGDDVVLDNKTHELPKNLVFAVSNTVSNSEPFTEKSVKLTATVKPDHATNKALNWSVNWVDSQSNWASGKNISDYLTLSIDGVIATLTCKAPFGEKANIVAQSVDNANAKSTCVIDFLSDFKIKYSFFIKKENTYQEFGYSVLEKNAKFDIDDSDNVVVHNPSVKLIDFDFDANLSFDSTGLIYYFKMQPVYTVGTVHPVVNFASGCKLDCLSSSFTSLVYKKYNKVLEPVSGSTILLDKNSDGYYEIPTKSLTLYIISNTFNADLVPILNTDIFIRESFNNCSMKISFVGQGTYSYNSLHAVFNSDICFGIDESTCDYFDVKTVTFDKSNELIALGEI